MFFKKLIAYFQNYEECSICTTKFHFYCTEITEANFKKMSKNTKSRFSCILCQNSEHKIISDPISNLDAKMENLLNSVSFISKKFDDFNKKLEFE